ncbi:hypothetical protein BS17DRAFT_815028 [Gyrodon lividus]|nr:hypothetical protein BS17DRAFT_815028 [Gyrodon lividus]
MFQQLDVVYIGVKEITSVPSFIKQANGSYTIEETMGDDTGVHKTWVDTQYNAIKSKLLAMCMHIITIKCTQAQALAQKSEAKQTIQQHACAAVGDALPDPKAIAAMIHKEVAAAAKTARITMGGRPPKNQKAKPKKAAAAAGKKQQQTLGSHPKNSKHSKNNKGKGKVKA